MAVQLHPLRQLLGLLGMRPTNARDESAGASAPVEGPFSQLLESLLPGKDVQETTPTASFLGNVVSAEGAAVGESKTEADVLTGLPATEEPEGGNGPADLAATADLAALLNLASSVQFGPALGQGTNVAPSPQLIVQASDVPAANEATIVPHASQPATANARTGGPRVLLPQVPVKDMAQVLEAVEQGNPKASESVRMPENTIATAAQAGPAAQQRPVVEQHGATRAPDGPSVPEQRETPHAPRAAADEKPELPTPGTEALDRKPADEPPAAAERRTAPPRAPFMMRKVSPVVPDGVDVRRGLTHIPAHEGEEKRPSKARIEPVREGGSSATSTPFERNVLHGRAYTASFGSSSPAAGETKNPQSTSTHAAAVPDQPATGEPAPADQPPRPVVASIPNSSSGQATEDGPGARAIPIFDAHTTKAPAANQVSGAPGNEGVPLPPMLSRGVMDQVVKSLTLQVEKKSSEMHITLQPASLGEVKLHVRMEEGRMQAQIDVTQLAVKSALEANLPQLRQELASRGIEMHRFDVFTSDQAFPRDTPGGRGDRAKNQGGWRTVEPGTVEQYQGSRNMGYNTMELIM